MEPWVVATTLIFLYLVLALVIGLIANRRSKDDLEDFLLMGRKAGFVMLYLTVVATYHSAFAFLGSGGFFYTHGIGFWVAGTWTVLVGGDHLCSWQSHLGARQTLSLYHASGPDGRLL